ncbi:MAG: rhomboid family intramembrane serine protease [Cellvibrionaceae bacterium]
MVIIPTEKRFDWKHAPIILFSIVFINIVIFFIYQSGDGEKLESAFNQYKNENYLEIEWPFLQQYLSENKDQVSLDQYQLLYDQKKYDELIFNIILRVDFYRYLRIDQYDYFQLGDVGDWFTIREEINIKMASTSILSFGLTPSNLKAFHFISYQFLHGNLMHLLGNLFFLIVCGFAVEAAIGRWRFLLFYLVSGIAGGLLHTVFNLKEAIPLVGASGSISGVMAMYLGLFRLKKIEFFYWFFIFVGYFKAPALLILFFYIGKELFQFYSDNQSNVAFLAHTGGFIAGAILMGILHYTNRSLFNQTYIEEDQSINPLQERLATIYDFIGKYQFEAAEKSVIRTIKEYGATFELALIHYNLTKNSNNPQQLAQLITLKNISKSELEKVDRIWNDNIQQFDSLNEDIIIKAGLSLSKSGTPSTAEGILLRLLKKKSTHESLPVLAGKVAQAFGSINDLDNKKKYLAVAKNLLARKK